MKQILTMLEMNEIFVDRCRHYETMDTDKQASAWNSLKDKLVTGGSFETHNDLVELSATLSDSHGWKLHQVLAYFDLTNDLWGKVRE